MMKRKEYVLIDFQISEWYKGKRRLKSKMEIDPATQVKVYLYIF